MLQSLNSLNSAMISLSAMKTIHSVKTQVEGRSNVLKAEIESGNGNIEAKEEKLAANEEKLENVTQNLNKNLTEINENINKPMTEEEKEKLIEEKREAKKEAEKKAIRETTENTQKSSAAAASDSLELSRTGSAKASALIGVDSNPDIHAATLPQSTHPENALAPVTYNAASIAVSDLAPAGAVIDVTA